MDTGSDSVLFSRPHLGGPEVNDEAAVIGQVEPALAVEAVAPAVLERLFADWATSDNRCCSGLQWPARQDPIGTRRWELWLRLRIGESESVAQTSNPTSRQESQGKWTG